MGKDNVNKMTLEEKQQWDELYQYVKKEIMQYDDKQSLPKNIILRLKGLTQGKFIANNKQKSKANYSYDIILYTFKINKQTIMNAIYGKTFKSEMSKFIYIAAIIENNINDVYLRINNAKKSKQKTEIANVDSIYNEGAEYQRKTEDVKITKKLEGLW